MAYFHRKQKHINKNLCYDQPMILKSHHAPLNGGEAYTSLPESLKRIVDHNVAARAELISGYKQFMDAARAGDTGNVPSLDRLEIQYKQQYHMAASETVSKALDEAGDTQENGLSRSQLRQKLQHAMEEQARLWDEQNPELLQGLDKRKMEQALARLHEVRSKPKENTKLDAQTNHVPTLLEDLLGKNPGLAIADHHTFDDAHDLVTDHMEALKESGVRTIFIELAPKTAAALNRLSAHELETLASNREYKGFKLISPEENATYFGVARSDDVHGAMVRMVASAKRHGIDVIGIDEPNPRGIPTDTPLPYRRVTRTNAIWTEHVKTHMQHSPGKFIVIGGRAHFTGTNPGRIPAYQHDRVHDNGMVDELLGILPLHLPKTQKTQALRLKSYTHPHFLTF